MNVCRTKNPLKNIQRKTFREPDALPKGYEISWLLRFPVGVFLERGELLACCRQFSFQHRDTVGEDRFLVLWCHTLAPEKSSAEAGKPLPSTDAP